MNNEQILVSQLEELIANAPIPPFDPFLTSNMIFKALRNDFAILPEQSRSVMLTACAMLIKASVESEYDAAGKTAEDIIKAMMIG